MAIELPDVSETWIANVAPYIAAMAELIDSVKAARDESLAAIGEIQAALDGLHGGDVSVGVDAAGAAAAAAAADDAAAASAKEATASHAAAEASGDAARSAYDEAAAYKMVTAAMGDAAKASAALAFAETALAFADREATAAAADSGHTASDALHGVIGAMRGATTATRFFGLSWSALHWILGVSAETLAVVVPAIIALGAGLDVAMQGAVNAGAHMEALWTAAEATGAAFHQTLGTLLGLKPALQQAQDAANPGVYEILGSAVNDAKAHMASLATAGLDVVHMFDEFSARITVDMQSMAKSGEMQALLGNMVSDLQELGQVFGNVGHAILNFAADMPGLAEVLLSIVDGISKVILWVSQLPHDLILGAMALEEFYRWGGLAASIIARIGLLLPALAGAPLGIAAGLFSRLAGIMGSVVGVGAQLVSGLAKVAGTIVGEDIPVIGALSGKLTGLSEDMAAAAENTALMGEIGLAVAAFTGLAVVISHVKDANEQLASSSLKAVKAASDMQVLSVIAQNLVLVGSAADRTTADLNHMSGTMQTAGAAVNIYSAATGVGLEGALKTTASFSQNLANGSQIINSAIPSFGGLASAAAHLWASFSGASTATSDVNTLSQAQESLIGTFRTVTGNISYLSNAYHVTGAAAVSLAQEAGVNLQVALNHGGQAAQIANQQIRNLVQGLGAMSAPAGVVGNDMEALGIQSQLAGTKVQQLNQAWDAWISSVTGTMADMSQVQTAVGTMAQDVQAKTRSITGAISSLSTSGTQMTYTLKGMGADAMQSWQQLTSALNQGNSALDQLRTGMAEGVVTGGQFRSTVQGLVGEMLPFVKGNADATQMLSNLAHEAGGPVTTSLQQLAEWTGVKGKAAADQFAAGMNKASLEMGSMSQAAQNLSAVVSDDLNQAMAQAINNVTHIAPLTQAYVSDLNRYGANAWQTKAAQAALNTAEQEGARLARAAGNAAATAGGQMSTAARYANALASAIENIPSQKTVDIQIVSSQGLHAIAAAGAAGHAAGTPNAAPGLALVGEQGPELMMMHGGEAIFNATETARMLSSIPSAIFGATGGSRASSGGAGGGTGGGALHADIHSHVYLDGKEIWTGMQTETLRYGVRNGSAQTGAWAPGSGRGR